MEGIQFQFVKSVPTEAVVDLYKAGNWWKEAKEAREKIPPMVAGSFAFCIAIEEKSNKIIGMGRTISDGFSDAYIQDVVVFPEYRNQGIGSQIVFLLTEFCKEKGLGWIGLIGEPGTASFYEKLGYKKMLDYQPMLYSN